MKRDYYAFSIGREEPLKLLHEREFSADYAIQELVESRIENRAMEYNLPTIYSAVLGWYLSLRPYIVKYIPEKAEILENWGGDDKDLTTLVFENLTYEKKHQGLTGVEKEKILINGLLNRIDEKSLVQMYNYLKEIVVELDLGAPTPYTVPEEEINDLDEEITYDQSTPEPEPEPEQESEI